MYIGIMPRVSRIPLKKGIYEEINEHFSYLIASMKSANDIDHFFRVFLTEEERTMLSKRLMLHLLLETGRTGGQIAAILHVSKETIRVHRHVWKSGDELYKNIIKQIAQRKRLKEFWRKVEKVFTPIELALRAKTDMRARAKLASGDWT